MASSSSTNYDAVAEMQIDAPENCTEDFEENTNDSEDHPKKNLTIIRKTPKTKIKTLKMIRLKTIKVGVKSKLEKKIQKEEPEGPI